MVAVSMMMEIAPSLACTAGVADGEVTFDGRPLLWKIRNEIDEINDNHYFAADSEHFPGMGSSVYDYLGMGPADDSLEGPVRQGLNSQGLAVGWNVLQDPSGWEELHHQALGNYNTLEQVRNFLTGMSDLTTINYFIDSSGNAALWENQIGLDQHWEYNTRSSARDNQWIDVDNADNDNDHTTGTDLSLSGWVVRDNNGHFRIDGGDILRMDGRYRVGRDIVGQLIFNNGHASILSPSSLSKNFFRNNTLAIDTTVSNMIVHGVKSDEDPRLSTMWTLLGHSETGIFVPVWISGVRTASGNMLPRYLNHADDGISAYTPARSMFNLGFNQEELQARTLPFEAHIFDVVLNYLLPQWRNQDWTDSATVETISLEMMRVQNKIDENAYGHLNYLFNQGAVSNYAPSISIEVAEQEDLTITIGGSVQDSELPEYNQELELCAAGTGDLTCMFNYGDGQTGSSTTHTYEHAGRYLVSCTVTDDNDVSQTDWIFVSVYINPCLGDQIYDALNDRCVDGPVLQFEWHMDTDPGWSSDGGWAWGTPTGGGGQQGNPDPVSGHTGDRIYGYNLSGDYENEISEKILTSAVIDCRNLSQVTLKFWRWLGVEDPMYDHARVRVRNSETTWVEIWSNSEEITDDSWRLQEYDISRIADNHPEVYVQWVMGSTDDSGQYCGWNIDDVEIWSIGADGLIDNCPDIMNPDQADSDNDNIGDACDICPMDPLDDIDADSICGDSDNCPLIPNFDQLDSDADGWGDVCEACDNDPGKTEPGECGCGIVDADTDGDGSLDCFDGCVEDPNKQAPGICGCDLPDIDSDGDGVLDCNDECPTDADKIQEGQCGCGLADIDSDGDDTADCDDECPLDPEKTKLGECGCGVAETDTDGNGIPDCIDPYRKKTSNPDKSSAKKNYSPIRGGLINCFLDVLYSESL